MSRLTTFDSVHLGAYAWNMGKSGLKYPPSEATTSTAILDVFARDQQDDDEDDDEEEKRDPHQDDEDDDSEDGDDGYSE